MKPTDSLLIERMKANAMLHLSRNASYGKLSRSRFRGRVLMDEIRDLLAKSARNGAIWHGGELTAINEQSLGMSRRSLFRALKTAPHFRITRKVALVERDYIGDFLKSK